MTALICLTYDDALPGHREQVAPDLTERGLRGTFYLPAARDDVHEGLAGWQAVAAAGHELGNHSCWHPCRFRPEWNWPLPTYHLENYDRLRLRDELVLANRVLHLVDGRDERSYAAVCSDLRVGPGEGESVTTDLRDLFTVVRAGPGSQPQAGPLPFVVPALHGDGRRADDIIAVAESMRNQPESWLVVAMHGVGAGTHNSFVNAAEHRRLIDWITAQRGWLEAVTVLEAAHRRRP